MYPQHRTAPSTSNSFWRISRHATTWLSPTHEVKSLYWVYRISWSRTSLKIIGSTPTNKSTASSTVVCKKPLPSHMKQTKCRSCVIPSTSSNNLVSIYCSSMRTIKVRSLKLKWSVWMVSCTCSRLVWKITPWRLGTSHNWNRNSRWILIPPICNKNPSRWESYRSSKTCNPIRVLKISVIRWVIWSNKSSRSRRKSRVS